MTLLLIVLALVVGCASPSHLPGPQMAFSEMSCGQIKAELDQARMIRNGKQRSLAGSGAYWWKKYRGEWNAWNQRAYELTAAYEDICVQDRKNAQEQRIEHIDEKLDIERDERRHGEVIDAIRDGEE